MGPALNLSIIYNEMRKFDRGLDSTGNQLEINKFFLSLASLCIYVFHVINMTSMVIEP